MPPKSKKKKSAVKKIVSGDMEETIGNSLLKKMGRSSQGSEYGSEYQVTPRDSMTGDDPNFNSIESGRVKNEEEQKNAPKSTQHKNLSDEGDL